MWSEIVVAALPSGASRSGLSRLLREMAKAGIAAWNEGGRLGLVAEEAPPEPLVRFIRSAAGDLLCTNLPRSRPGSRDPRPWTAVDLETVGPEVDPGRERYVRECRVVCAVALVGGEFLAFVPEAKPGPRELVEEGGKTTGVEYVADSAEFVRRVPGPWVAHNAAGFDARVWAAKGFPPPSGVWLDSLPAARRLGLPGALDLLGEKLCGAGKRGRDALAEYARRDRGGLRASGLQSTIFDDEDGPKVAPNAAADPDLLLARVVAYCARDVAILAEALSKGVWAEVERGIATGEHAVWEADRRVQQRGFWVDEALSVAISNLDARLVEARLADAAEAAGFLGRDEAERTVRSPKRLREWLATRGRNVTDTRRGTLENLAAEEEDDEVGAVLGARLAEARVHRKKLEVARSESDDGDGRIQRWGAYYAAHTGRWGGRGFQPQNLPRSVLGGAWARAVEAAAREDLAALESIAVEAGVDPSDALASLVRAVVAAPPGWRLVCADYAQVEARVTLWAAGDAAGLREFEEGDPYAAMAARVDGKPPPTEKADPRRQLGKIAVLACGYGLGAKRLSEQCAAQGLDIAALGTSAEKVVDAWRRSRPKVVRFWSDLERAFGKAATGETSQVGPILAEPAGDAVTLTLPSGRRVWYREPRMGSDGRWSFELARRGRVLTYGGKLTENCISGAARDLLGAALVELDRAGLDVVLHVHDEVLVEVDEAKAEEAKAEVVRILETGPAWARGLPIKAEAKIQERWS